VGVVAGTPYTSKYTNITVKGHVEVNGMAYVGAVGGKNAYADWTNITVYVDETSYVNANSVENGKAYRTYVGGVCGFNGEGGHSFKDITSNINVKGSTCDVGGLFGIAHYGNKFENCVCTGDVEIYAASEEADAQEIGGIAGVWHNENGYTVTFNSCSFDGTLKTNIEVEFYNDGLVGKAYSENGTGKLIVDGKITTLV
ncbi:MAG: peptidase A26, partial [Alistipes sp.]|nr:peptidase A26 [Alistipes sp.]